VDVGAPFAAVVTDLGMPYVDGRKVASAIKSAVPSTVVIMLTGWGQRLVADGDVPPHVDGVLSKPPKLRELRAALTEGWQAGVARGLWSQHRGMSAGAPPPTPAIPLFST